MGVEQLIFTDWPAGKGVEPSGTGLQIKACSPGVSAEVRRQLYGLCMHYGNALHHHPPAYERQGAWQGENGIGALPDTLLDEFPVVWTYDRLADEVFSLTRLCYIGLTRNEPLRHGNFLAHALIFPPESLAGHGFNPLTLARTQLFRASDVSEDTVLPVLDLVGAVEPAPSAPLRQAPYREHLAAMVAALSAATPAMRPVILCLDEWGRAAPLLEALLDLLPPWARCRTTFTTYESDRSYLVQTGTGGRPVGQTAAHHLIVMWGDRRRPLDLRPDELRSQFAVFDFVESRFSDLGAPPPYATFAAGCVSDGELARLRRLHTLVEALALQMDPRALATLIPCVTVDESRADAAALVEAARSLVTIATARPQVLVALDLLLPYVRALAARDDAAALAAIGADLAALGDRLDDDAEAHPLLSTVRGLASEALARGRARTVAALLQASGRRRSAVLLAVLTGAAADLRAAVAAASSSAEATALTELIVDGVRALEGTANAAPVPTLVMSAFHAAARAGLVADVWRRIGESAVMPELRGELDDAKQRWIEELLDDVPAEQCPEAMLRLNLTLIEARRPQGEVLLASLERVARACTRSAEPDRDAGSVVGVARQRCAGVEELVESLGRMAEASQGSPVGQRLLDAYRTEMQEVEPQCRDKIRHRLAAARATRVLCRDLLDDVLPWDDAASPRKLRPWQDGVLNSPPLLDAMRAAVAVRLSSERGGPDALPLARALMPRRDKAPDASPGLVALCHAIALALPVEPLADRWRTVLLSVPEGLSSEARSRLRVLQFMRSVEDRARDERWSITEFPRDDAASRDVAALGFAERTQVLEWCLRTVQGVGVSSPQEAQALVGVLERFGERSTEAVADAVGKLLRGRDPVTCVLVAAAFARCGLEAGGDLARWGGMVKAILDRGDRETRRLFESHLRHRFCRGGPKYEERLAELCQTAGLPKPTRPAPAAEERPADRHEASEVSKVADIVDRVRRSWRNLFRGSKSPPSSPEGSRGG